MITNCTLLFLQFSGSFYSPFLLSPRLSFSNDYIFQNVNIQNLINTAIYSTIHNRIHIRNSRFSNILRSAIFLSSFNRYENDTIFTSHIFIPTDQWINLLDIQNCCFVRCSSTDDGGAIKTEWDSSNIQITSSIFDKCTAVRYGGAIFSSRQIDIRSTIFTQCQSGQRGSILSLNFNVISGLYAYIIIDQILAKNNIGKEAPFDFNTSSSYCRNTNITNNQNTDHNLPDSPIQYCCAYSCIVQNDQGDAFEFINLVGNNGDYLIDLKLADSQTFSYINVINNVNLNFFFKNHPDQTNQNLENLAFFENKVNSKSDRIKFANSDTSNKITLVNCVFEYTEQEVNLMLNSHNQIGGLFGQTIKTFIQNQLLVKPSFCVIDSDCFTASHVFSNSGFFSNSVTFSQSKKFTLSIEFSESKKFTLSSIFSPSKEFTSSSPFSPSKEFTSSFPFSPSKKFTSSSPFSPSMSFTASSHFSLSSPFSSSSSFSPSDNSPKTSNFSPSSHFSMSFEFSESSHFIGPTTSSGTFTPSSHFTPSNFFTPNRTKVPDPKNIFQRPDVSGSRKEIFSKEEVKKAAAPLSISLILIIVAIVFSILYIKRKLKDLKRDQEIPDFDTSLADSDESDSDYSYSYYTYSYTYESVDNSTDSYYYSDSSITCSDYYSDFTYSMINEHGW